MSATRASSGDARRRGDALVHLASAAGQSLALSPAFPPVPLACAIHAAGTAYPTNLGTHTGPSRTPSQLRRAGVEVVINGPNSGSSVTPLSPLSTPLPLLQLDSRMALVDARHRTVRCADANAHICFLLSLFLQSSQPADRIFHHLGGCSGDSPLLTMNSYSRKVGLILDHLLVSRALAYLLLENPTFRGSASYDL